MVVTKPIIAVDIDDVLVLHFQDLMEWYNQEYGTQLTPADNHPTSANEHWGPISQEEAVQRVHRFFDTAKFKQATPYKEAKEVLTHLSKRFDLVVITARDTIIEALTRQWLLEHFNELFIDAHFTALYNLEGKSRSKADVCRAISASYLIDDVLDTAIKAARVGVNALLFGNYIWNQRADVPTGVTRVKDWHAVQEYFDGR